MWTLTLLTRGQVSRSKPAVSLFAAIGSDSLRFAAIRQKKIFNFLPGSLLSFNVAYVIIFIVLTVVISIAVVKPFSLRVCGFVIALCILASDTR